MSKRMARLDLQLTLEEANTLTSYGMRNGVDGVTIIWKIKETPRKQ